MGLKLEWDTETLPDGRIQLQADCGGYVACVQSFGQSVGVIYWEAFVRKAGRLPVEESRSAWSDHNAKSIIAAQEAAEAAAARLLAEDAGVRALLGMDEIQTAMARMGQTCVDYGALYVKHKQLERAFAMEKAARAEERGWAATLESIARWIPVGERLPDEGARVLVAFAGLGDEPSVQTLRRSLASVDDFYWEDDAGARGSPLLPGDHWRPLPAARWPRGADMSQPTPDTPETRAALALPTKEAATALGVHPGSVRRLRKRLGVVPPVEAPMPVLVVRVPVELREALDREAAFLRRSVAEMARQWMETGAANALTNPDNPLHGVREGYGGFGQPACGREFVRYIGPRHPGWPGVTCAECRKAMGMEMPDAT